MEVTNVHLLRLNQIKSLTINLHHVLSIVTMDDPAVFTDFLRYTLGVTTQKKIDVIINFVESFGGLLAVIDGDIDTFFKYSHSADNARVAAQRIFISNNVTQGLKSMSFEIKDRELCNYLPDELDLRGINADQISIVMNNRNEAREYLKRRERQSHPDMKVPMLTGANFKEFDLAFIVTVRRKNALIVILLDYLFRPYEVGNYDAAWNYRK